MKIFDMMFDCGTHRRFDALIEGQREIVTSLKEGQRETDDILERINETLKGDQKETVTILEGGLKETNTLLQEMGIIYSTLGFYGVSAGGCKVAGTRLSL